MKKLLPFALVVWIFLDDGSKLTFPNARGFYFDRYVKDRITLLEFNKPIRQLYFKAHKVKWVACHQ